MLGRGESYDFESYKATLDKEPVSSSAKKEYYVGCTSKADWTFIHEELMKDGSLEDNIPSDAKDCANDCLHSDTRGVYLLTDAEATALRNHEKVTYVHLNTTKYPGTYMDDPDKVAEAGKNARYGSTVKHQRDPQTSNYIPASPDSTLKNRGSYQLKRHMQKDDPWNGTDDATILNDRIHQYGTGKHVDVIVGDQDMWFGHIEFQNNLGGPDNYEGGNVLPGNGSCDLLDVVLEAPYYIDPDFFDADASRKETRWDGTTVPKEVNARAWWTTNATSARSAKFVSSSNGGSASGTDDFGTISIPAGYTRANSNGTNLAYQTGTGFHGTPCASQAYGRQYGWAYNANKWFINAYGTNNVGWEAYFDLMKVFHNTKPVNSLFGTKDPTVNSNSWGHRRTAVSTGYYYFRQGTTGSGGVSYSGTYPAFMNYYTGDGSKTRVLPYTDGHAALTAGEELIDSGVIFVTSAGNNNQKLVNSSHADYNNYNSVNNNTALASSTVSGYSSMGGHTMLNTHNRPGFPSQIGKDVDGTTVTYKTISIGALDDDNRSGDGKERKVSYSNMGEATDCFASADQTLAACEDNTSTRYNRNDSYYTISGQQSVESEDRLFSGTSSACPIATGIIATKLEFNRDWNWYNVRQWLSGLDAQNSSKFYIGTEATTATDTTNWGDYDNLQGARATVIYDALTGGEDPKDFSITGDIDYSGQLTFNFT